MVVGQVDVYHPLERLLLAELGQPERELFELVACLPLGSQLVAFLFDNPNTFSTTDSIAFRINENADAVESTLHGLSRLGMVQRLDVGPTLWGLTGDEKLRKSAGELVGWQTRWKMRLARVKMAIEGKFENGPLRCSAHRDGICQLDDCMSCSNYLVAAASRLAGDIKQ